MVHGSEDTAHVMYLVQEYMCADRKCQYLFEAHIKKNEYVALSMTTANEELHADLPAQ